VVPLGIYLDNAATSFPKPEPVCQGVAEYLKTACASLSRGSHRGAVQVEEMFLETRSLLGELFNVKPEHINRIVFASGATEALNTAVQGLLKPGSHVITSGIEHNALWRPLKMLEREGIVELSVIPCPEGHALDPEELANALRDNTALVAVTHASNVTGAIQPIPQIGQICREAGIPLLVDGAQTGGVYPIDVDGWNISLLAFTGHKGLMGPQGTGGLYIGPELELKPLKYGGTGSASLPHEMPAWLPDRFEAGTPNGPGIAGLRAAVKFIIAEGLEQIRRHELELAVRLQQGLAEIPGVTVYGPADPAAKVPIVSCNVGGVDSEEVAYVLDEVYDIQVRAGLHCAPQAHRALGTLDQGAVRFSIGYFNTKEQIDAVLEVVEVIARG
jgi:cysteine desulfurase family protein